MLYPILRIMHKLYVVKKEVIQESRKWHITEEGIYSSI